MNGIILDISELCEEKSTVVTLLYVILFLIGLNSAIHATTQWPYTAVPFSYSPQGGFFFSADSSLRFNETNSLRRKKTVQHVFVVSADKKAIRLNGEKIAHSDLTAWGKDVKINGILASEAVHFFVDCHHFKGFLIVPKRGHKLYGYKRHMTRMLDVDSAFIGWHTKEQSVLSSLENTFEDVIQKQPAVVRVLLSKADATVSTRWKFTSQKGFWIHVIGKDVTKKMFCKEKVTFTIKQGHIFYNGKQIDHDIKIEPLCGYADYDGVEYDGYFSIKQENKSAFCINHVDLENYIVGVLRTESWPGWPLEVNKAFAITCRSYVASKMFEAGTKDKLFHVKNTNVHQTYRGRHDVAVLKQAVNLTKGIVLGYNQKPILAMFDSCCGGIIPAYIDDFDFNKVPYLARTYACNHCKHCSLYSWSVSYDWHVFEELMRQHDKSMYKVHDVRVSKKDKAGVVLEVQLKGIKGHTIMSGKQIYSLCKEIKSFHFDIHKKAGKITVSGRGFGHHIGLCQWGARQMVRDGWDYKSILRFYYPQTYFMKLA